jgi:predicted acyltransferase
VTTQRTTTRTGRPRALRATDVAATLVPPLLILAALLASGQDLGHAARTGLLAALPMMAIVLLLVLGARRTRHGPREVGCHAELTHRSGASKGAQS